MITFTKQEILSSLTCFYFESYIYENSLREVFASASYFIWYCTINLKLIFFRIGLNG